jgi:hypothetical protein
MAYCGDQLFRVCFDTLGVSTKSTPEWRWVHAIRCELPCILCKHSDALELQRVFEAAAHRSCILCLPTLLVHGLICALDSGAVKHSSFVELA